MPRLAAPTIAGRAAATLARARDCLLAQQNETGWWKGELETNVTMEAEDLLMRRFLGVPLDDVLEPTAAWIRRQQRADGTWAKFYGGPGDLSTTVEAYAALRLAGDPADAGHLRLAREFILDGGGLCELARLHPAVARAVRRVALGCAAGDAPRAHLPAFAHAR